MAAKLAVAVLFFLFAIASARAPVDLPEDDITVPDFSTDLPKSDPRTATSILLPSEKPDSEFATITVLEPETEPKAHENEIEEEILTEDAEKEKQIMEEGILTEDAEKEKQIMEEGILTEDAEKNKQFTETEPLTFVSFRPVNRRFPQRPFLGHRRGCHHHHNHRRGFKPWDQRFNGREVSFGKDMIQWEGGEDKFHGGVGPRFSYGHGMKEEEEEKMPKTFHGHRHHHHHHHNHHDMEEEVEDEEMDHKHEGGLMGKIRKFLIHF